MKTEVTFPKEKVKTRIMSKIDSAEKNCLLPTLPIEL